MICTTPGIHGQHTTWESDISLWRDDIRVWQQELATSEAHIKQLEEALAEHKHAMRIHASALRLEEQTIEEHEHAIAEYEKGGEGEELLEMARRHTGVATSHHKHRTDHEQLKRRHHNIITHWNLLLKALLDPATDSHSSQTGPERR